MVIAPHHTRYSSHLCVTWQEDLLVPIEESLTLENDMKEQGLSIEIDRVDGADHVLRDQKKGGWNGMVDGWENIAKRALNWAVDLVK